MRRLTRAATTVACVVVLLGASPDAGWAQPNPPAQCQPPVSPSRSEPRVILSFSRDGGSFTDAEASFLSEWFFSTLRPWGPRLQFLNIDQTFQPHLQAVAEELLDGGPANLDILVQQLRSEFVVHLTFGVGSQRLLSAHIVNNGRSASVGGVSAILSDNVTQALIRVIALAKELGRILPCRIRDTRLHPVRPVLALVAPEVARVGGTLTVEVTLSDAGDDPVHQAGERVTIRQVRNGQTVNQESATTNDAGVATFTLLAGNTRGVVMLQALYEREEDGFAAPPAVRYYNVEDPTGAVAVSAPRAALRVGETETVTATLRRNGVPAAGEPVAFSTTEGGVTQPVVTTDGAGRASTEYQTPAADTFVEVTASAAAQPAPPLASPGVTAPPAPPEPPLTASLTLVVDAGVALALSADDTLGGGTSTVIADLDVGGVVMPGIPVAFVVSSGLGHLSATTVDTDAAGRAQVSYLAPSSPTTATVTASVVVEGQTYTRTVTINVGALPGEITVTVAEACLAFDSASNRECSDGTTLPLTLFGHQTGVTGVLTATRPSADQIAADVNLTTVGFDAAINHKIHSSTAFLVLRMKFPQAGSVEVRIDPAVFGTPERAESVGVGVFTDLSGTGGQIVVGTGEFIKIEIEKEGPIRPLPSECRMTFAVSPDDKYLLSLIAGTNGQSPGPTSVVGRAAAVTFRPGATAPPLGQATKVCDAPPLPPPG